MAIAQAYALRMRSTLKPTCLQTKLISRKRIAPTSNNLPLQFWSIRLAQCSFFAGGGAGVCAFCWSTGFESEAGFTAVGAKGVTGTVAPGVNGIAASASVCTVAGSSRSFR